MATETKKEEAKKEEKSTKLEMTVTVLLGVVTVLGALAAYFSALWGGEQNSNYIKSISEKNRASTIYLDAINDLTSFQMNDMKDDMIYSEWKQHVEKGDADATYYFTKLSEGLQKDLADDPKDVSQYEKEQEENLAMIGGRIEESEKINKEADELMQKGQDANKFGDGFTLCTVLFTVVLFFLGLSTIKTKESLQKAYVGMAVVVMVLSIIRFVTVPFPPL